MVRTLRRWRVFVYSIRRSLTNDISDGAWPDPDSSNNPELNCVLPLHNEFDFASLGGSEGLKVDNSKPQKIASSSPVATVRCRRSSMRKWRNCTSLHSTVLTREQADYIGVNCSLFSPMGCGCHCATPFWHADVAQETTARSVLFSFQYFLCPRDAFHRFTALSGYWPFAGDSEASGCQAMPLRGGTLEWAHSLF